MQLQTLAGAYALVAELPLPVDAAVERWQDAFWNILARKAGACVAVAGIEHQGGDLVCGRARGQLSPSLSLSVSSDAGQECAATGCLPPP